MMEVKQILLDSPNDATLDMLVQILCEKKNTLDWMDGSLGSISSCSNSSSSSSSIGSCSSLLESLLEQSSAIILKHESRFRTKKTKKKDKKEKKIVFFRRRR